jgi:adenylate cyclase
MYYRIISAFCVVFFMAINSPVKINGQSLDSLLYLLDNNLFKDDADKYGLLCKIISKSSDADSTLRYCDEAIKLAEEMEINPGEPCIFQGENYLNSGFLVSALEYFIKAANYYKADHNNEGLASAYLYIAETYNLQEDHNNETLYLKNAIEIYKEEKDSVNLAQALHNLGYAKFSMGLYDTALVLFSTTGEIFQKLNYPTGYAYCIGNSGLVYSRQSEYDKAEDYLLRAIEMLTRYGDDRAVTQFMIEYANVLDYKDSSLLQKSILKSIYVMLPKPLPDCTRMPTSMTVLSTFNQCISLPTTALKTSGIFRKWPICVLSLKWRKGRKRLRYYRKINFSCVS